MPEGAMADILGGNPDHVVGGFQAYRRYYIDMANSFDAYFARFSSKTRSTLNRKRRKLAAESGGQLDIGEYRSPQEIADFLELALPLSRLTYQARLLDAGLPESDAARTEMLERAQEDRLRAYLLFMGGRPVSYLYLPIDNGVISYAFLGYDPDVAALSPGTVLQLEALERLFAERKYRYFDFTEGEGAHKQLFGTDSAAACSFFLLKGTAVNHLLLGTLRAFDSSVATAKRLAEHGGAAKRIRQALRG